MWKLKISSRLNQIHVRQRLQGRCDRMAIHEIGPPYTLLKPDGACSPLVLSSPHSGRLYPKAFQAQSLLSLHQLRQSEDCYIDRLFAPACGLGIPVLAANFPRIMVDVNRGADEWAAQILASDRSPPLTQRARLGFGVVPTRIGRHVDIYPHELDANLIERRLKTLYHPYHGALSNLLQAAKRTFGHAVLLDCHSMPGSDGAGQVDIVLGNRYGASCRPETMAFVENVFTGLGYKTARNHPYAGGFITAHYGQPYMNIEAVQIEINKDLYLDPVSLERHGGWDKLAANMQAAIAHINAYFTAPDRIAAQ